MSVAFSHASFVESLGSKFKLKNESSESFELELLEVSELKRTELYDSFSITFRCASAEVLPQSTYRLEQEKMGELELFLVPISRDQGGVSYEAVFSLTREEAQSSGAKS